MGKDSNLIISARQPVLQADGTFTPSWFRFLEALSQLTAGAQFTTADVLLDEATNDNGIAQVEQTANEALLLAQLATGEGENAKPQDPCCVPYFIPAGKTFHVPINIQELFAMTIDNEGVIDVDGYLIEVD